MLKLTNSVGWFVSFALDSFASGTPLLNGPLAYANHHHLPTPSRPKGRRAQVAAAGNPVTGEGYLEGGSEKKEETPRRQRVPPGGFSSKLW